MKYIFRGVVVFDYNPKTNLMKIPNTEGIGNNFNFCKFIPEDYKLMSEFFQRIYFHSRFNIVDDEILKDYEVY